MSEPFVMIGDHLIDSEYAICPWCGEKHGDCWEWVKPEQSEERCQRCDNTFVVWAEHDVSYYTRKP